jgi:lipopolysaccharide export system permease protein
VIDNVLIDATFKHRAEKPPPGQVPVPLKPGESDEPAQFDQIVQAKRARIRFDLPNDVAHVYLEGADIQQGGANPSQCVFNKQEFDLPLPPEFKRAQPKRLQEMTDAEMIAEQAKYLDLIKKERKRQAAAAALYIASGRLDQVNWKEFQAAFVDYAAWQQWWNERETERRMRCAMAWGSFFFVMLGAPVGIRFARRDFLSAFITCFVPIILVYYPLTLLAVNVGKDGMLNPTVALWAGNTVLGVLAGLVLPPVIRH